MQYDLDILEEYCQELGFSSNRSSPHSLEIEILEGTILKFENLHDPEDTIVGFVGVPSHEHGKVTVSTGEEIHVRRLA